MDDIVVEDVGVDWKQPGGGALYSAIGASLWDTQVAMCSTVGLDYPADLLDELTRAGFDVSAVRQTKECNSLGLWLLYESSGARHQFEKAAGGTFRQLDALRPVPSEGATVPGGVHLAPQSSDGHATALSDLQGSEAVVTLDLLVEQYMDSSRYLEVGFLQRVDAFLPSTAEVAALWGDVDAATLRAELARLGFTGHLVVKRGPDGVEVAMPDRTVRVPAAPSDVVDVTGAGDAFCGGFLAGLVLTGDPVAAAAHGVVSSSFVVETRGALAALAALDQDRASGRLESVFASLRSTA